jgi:dihydrofolate reductase
MTEGKAVVMGRRTFESLPGGPLKNRDNIVLSADRRFAPQGAAVCRSLPELREYLKQYAPDDVFVIGGQKVFEELIGYCKFAYVTRYDAEFNADRFFPDIRGAEGWGLANTILSGSHEGRAYAIELYENRAFGKP